MRGPHSERELPTKKLKIPLHNVDPAKVRPLRDHVFVRVVDRRFVQIKTEGGADLWAITDQVQGRRTETVHNWVIQKREFKIAEVLQVGPLVVDLEVGERVIVPTNARREGIALGGVVFNLTETPSGSSYDYFLKQGRRRMFGTCPNSGKAYVFPKAKRREWKDIRCECGSRFRVDLIVGIGIEAALAPPKVIMPDHKRPDIQGAILATVSG